MENPARNSGSTSTRVAVVGGGLSGLALALALSRRGIDVRVLEAAGRTGGTIGTGRERGWQWETGPNGILDRDGLLPPLVRELGIEGEVTPAGEAERDRYVYAAGRLWSVRLSPRMLLGGPLTLGARLRLLAEPLSGRRRTPDESIAEFGRRHVGRQAVARLLDPMVTGIWAGDVEQLSLPACFPRMAELEARSRSLVFGALGAMRRARREKRVAVGARLTSFTGGMQALTDALARRLGDVVRTNAAVRAIEPAPDGRSWRLRLDGGELVTDTVALCAPAAAQADLLAPHDAAAADVLRAIPYVPVSVVHLGFAAAEIGAVPSGFGFLAASSEKLPILGAVFASMIYAGRAPDGHHLYTCMIGGAREPEAAMLDDEALVLRAREGLERALGIAAAPAHARVVRWPRAIPQYTVGHLERVAALEAAEGRHPGLFLGGNALRGVSVADCLKQAAPLAERVSRTLAA